MSAPGLRDTPASPFAFRLIDRRSEIFMTRYGREPWRICARDIPPAVVDAALRSRTIGRLVDYDLAAVSASALAEGTEDGFVLDGPPVVLVSIDY